MNWTDEAYAEAERRDRADTDWYALSAESLFAEGVEWQRDQLRTDEAVARLANFLHNDDRGETIDEHEATCERDRGGCDAREIYMDYARKAITALLGEEQ